MTYVTGIGVVSAIGIGADANFASLCGKVSGIAPLRNFVSAHAVPVGEVKYTNEELRVIAGLPGNRTYSRTALLGIVAVREALNDAGVDPAEYGSRLGIVSANSAGGMDLSESFYKDMYLGERPARLRYVAQHDCGSSTEVIASTLGIKGFATTISTACSSSANALMLADRLLRSGRLDAVVAGGIDPLCLFTINGFSSLMILDEKMCRPFDNSRSGLNLGEGSGFVVLQRETSSHGGAYCRLVGYANANDAYHQTATSPDGNGPKLAMEGAMRMAKISASDVGYVNVHGTATVNNDLSEGRAMQRIFGEKVPPFSSTKVYTGHTLGAAGGVEAVFTAMSIKHKVLFPTFNFSSPIEELGLVPLMDVIRNCNVRYALSNSFGFGGNVSTLAFASLD